MKNLFCKIGLHRWEKDPSHKGFIKYTSDWGIWSNGVQYGTRICKGHCGAVQKVKRTGYSSMFGGGKNNKWKPI